MLAFSVLPKGWLISLIVTKHTAVLCKCHRRLLTVLEMVNWFSFSSRPIESVREQSVLISHRGQGFLTGKEGSCSCAIQVRKLILELDFLLLKARNSPGHSTHSGSKIWMCHTGLESHILGKQSCFFLSNVLPPLHPPNNSLVPGTAHSHFRSFTQSQHNRNTQFWFITAFWNAAFVTRYCKHVRESYSGQNHQPS